MLPQVTTDGEGNWVTVWTSGVRVNGTADTDYDIFVARSTDNGASWSVPALFLTNGAAGAGDDMVSQLTTDGVGNWIAVLGLDTVTGPDIFVARSTDSGTSWSSPALLNTHGSADAGYDRPPRVATDGDGKWIAVWASTSDLNGTTGTDGDIFVVTFTLGSIAGMPAVGNLAVVILVLSISAFYARRTHTRHT